MRFGSGSSRSADDARYARTAAANTFSERQTIRTDEPFSFRSGHGDPLGAPDSAPTAVVGDVGDLTGTYKYAYLETDNSGRTPLSPSVTVTPASQKVTVTVPMARPGTVSRRLYRTVAGGSDFFLLQDFASGDGYFQPTFVDNVADGSLGAAAPTTDTTGQYDLEVTDGVKYFSQHPTRGEPHDLTLINGDPDSTTGWCIDAYGGIVSRSRKGHSFISYHTGTVGGDHFIATYVPDTFGSESFGVCAVKDQGRLNLQRKGTGIALHVAPRDAMTTTGEGILQVDPAPGTSQPSAWMKGGDTGTSAYALYLQQTNAANTSAVLRLDHAGTGKYIINDDNTFSVENNGSVESSSYFRGSGLTTKANSGDAYVDLTSNRIQMVGRATGANVLRIAPPAGIATDILDIRDGAGTKAIAVTSAGHLAFSDTYNIVAGTGTGTKIGTATTQKLAFWNATPIAQPAGIANADGTLADLTTKFNSLLDKLETLGLVGVA